MDQMVTSKSLPVLFWSILVHELLFVDTDNSLIPNLSYISEAAASVLDRQLKLFIVPHTEVVWLSSKAFNYDWFDRRAYYRKGKPLPQKVGSFQIFLDGFRGSFHPRQYSEMRCKFVFARESMAGSI